MKYADIVLSKKLAALCITPVDHEPMIHQYIGDWDNGIKPVYQFTVKRPNYETRDEDFDAPRLDDIVYCLRDDFNILITVDLFLGSQYCYNIYDFDDQTYVPVIKDKMPLFDKYDDALYDAINLVIDEILPAKMKRLSENQQDDMIDCLSK